MPHFTLQILPQGPILAALLATSEARAQALIAAGQPVPEPVPLRALVDTGASCTCVDPAVMQQLQLAATGTAPIATPSTGSKLHQASQYDAGLIIPGGRPDHPPLIFPTIAIVGAELRNQGIDALIGRDILSLCMLNYNGSAGFFTLAY